MKKEGIKLTDAEKVILKNIDPKYKYIARDKSEKCLWLYMEKPHKLESVWRSTESIHCMGAFNHLFKFIKWTNKEPIFIDDLVNRQ